MQTIHVLDLYLSAPRLLLKNASTAGASPTPASRAKDDDEDENECGCGCGVRPNAAAGAKRFSPLPPALPQSLLA